MQVICRKYDASQYHTKRQKNSLYNNEKITGGEKNVA